MASGVNAIANLLGRVDANGALLVALSGGSAVASTLTLTEGGTAVLTTDAANVFAVRNGTGADQNNGFRIYEDFTDASNYSRINIRMGSTTGTMVLEAAGTFNNGYDFDITNSTPGSIQFATNNTDRWYIGSGGWLSVLGGNYGIYAGKTIVQGTTVSTINTAADVTYSGAQIEGNLILRDCNGGNRADLMPTAASLLTAVLPGVPRVGMSFEFTIRNTSSAAETITLTTNTGITLSGTMTIAQNNQKRFKAVFTNVTALSEAVTVYSLGTVVF